MQLSAGTQWLAEITEIARCGHRRHHGRRGGHGRVAVCEYGARTRLTGGTVSALEAETDGPAKQIVVAPNALPTRRAARCSSPTTATPALCS